MVTIAESAWPKPAGARIKPQAAAANPINVSKMARMAGLRFFRLVDVSRFNGRRSHAVQRNFKDFAEAQKSPAGGARPGLSFARPTPAQGFAPAAALRRAGRDRHQPW